MLCSMAIRMKEWGLLAYPRQGVHLPLNALNDWGRTGRALGLGVAEAGQGAAAFTQALEQVTRTGEQADAAALLEEIGRETTAEMLEQPVRDWDYSWQQAYAPRVHALLEQLPESEQAEVLRLSETYSRRSSLDARRRKELERIRSAREHWQQQVEAAVERGDEEAARRWLEQGRGVFVPEAAMPQEQEHLQSRCLQSRWQQQLQQNPLEALAEWRLGESARPAGGAELSALERSMQQARAGVLSQLAGQLSAAVEQGAEPDSPELEHAVAAGVLAPEQVEQSRLPRRALTTEALCDWSRRIDERSGNEEEQLVVDIALSPIPTEQKQRLLRRVQSTAAVPPQQRSAASRVLWNLYLDGRFGCPGDEEAMQCLGRLQEEALQRLATPQEKALEQWLAQLCQPADTWLCFADN